MKDGVDDDGDVDDDPNDACDDGDDEDPLQKVVSPAEFGCREAIFFSGWFPPRSSGDYKSREPP